VQCGDVLLQSFLLSNADVMLQVINDIMGAFCVTFET
jgi:hypothetical protein